MTHAQDVIELRELLDMNRAEFASILGVDSRTIARWEDGHAGPTGTSRAVLAAFREVLTRRSPDNVMAVQETLRSAEKVGGLVYLLVYLLDDWTSSHLGGQAPDADSATPSPPLALAEVEAKLQATQAERDALARELTERNGLASEIRELQRLLGVTRKAP